MIELTSGYAGFEAQIPSFYGDVFTASEGVAEGQALTSLVQDLMGTSEDDDLRCYLASEGEELLGCILFSRLFYDEDPRNVVLMSPVAVKTDRQKAGIGQRLIRFALDDLKGQGVDFAITYGDPAYYGKTGFKPMAQDFARPPQKLSQPHGWIGQSLAEGDAAPFTGPSRCVPAFDKPELW
ncbi:MULTISPECIES: GNAT family N-acetyltransferase [unclassified Ruegeria]|uniref:GNAT family N-acetyltransferase n=1 Tax=unclassified Ruegeria TaxID=2625375 RepID=UPI001488CD59|nr:MULTISPECIES: N-acetyltransferase [unclassified Ruegeria]